MVLVPSATAGGVPLVLARLVEGLSTHQCAGGPWRLEDRRNCSQVSPCAGRLPSGRGPNADRPSMSWATSTARRIAAATWIMSSTTVASRAYAVVPAKRSRWSRGGAYRPRSAPAAGSARHRADAGRRDRAARSPDPQPASCRRSFRRGYPARAAPSTPHHWRPRPDRQPVPGCVGRDVLAGACVPTSGPAGAVPVRVRSRSSAGLRWRRGRLWHPRRQHRPLRTGPGSGDRCEGRRFAPLARRIYVPGILSSQPSQVCPPAHGTVPERRANVQKGARPRGTDRRYSVPFRGSAGRRKDAGTCWLGCCPPEMSTGETHPRAKRPMNRAKTPLRRRAAPNNKLVQSGELPAETADYLAKERVKRGAAEYIPLSSGTDGEARQACSRGAAVLETVRSYLLNRGHTKDDLPEPERYRKAVTRGGDPGISLPSGRQEGGPPTPGDRNRGPTR